VVGAKPCSEKNRSGPSRSYSFIARNTSERVTWFQAIIYAFLQDRIGLDPWVRRVRCASATRSLLRLMARVVFRIDVGDHPRPDIVELTHRLLVHGHKVRGAWRKRDEASCRHGFRPARIGLLAHPDTEGSRDHGEEPAFESVCGATR